MGPCLVDEWSASEEAKRVFSCCVIQQNSIQHDILHQTCFPCSYYSPSLVLTLQVGEKRGTQVLFQPFDIRLTILSFQHQLIFSPPLLLEGFLLS